MKTLVVDDSAGTRSYLKVLLNLENMDLLEADSGERALVIARMVPLDLVIADINMAKLDGVELVRRFRTSTDGRLRALPVILLTGDMTDETRRRGLDAGATAFAHKPIMPAELKNLIKTIAEGKRVWGRISRRPSDGAGRPAVETSSTVRPKTPAEPRER